MRVALACERYILDQIYWDTDTFLVSKVTQSHPYRNRLVSQARPWKSCKLSCRDLLYLLPGIWWEHWVGRDRWRLECGVTVSDKKWSGVGVWLAGREVGKHELVRGCWGCFACQKASYHFLLSQIAMFSFPVRTGKIQLGLSLSWAGCVFYIAMTVSH